MSKKTSETTIKTSIRIRPCSDREKDLYPGPSVVQAAPGEVRLYVKQAGSLNTCSAAGRRETVTGSRQRPSTPSRPVTPNQGASAAQTAWHAMQQQQALSSDYQSYPFASVYGPETQSADVYSGSGCRDIVESVLAGCNGTIFVYGQTGAGKTFTMDACSHLVLQHLYSAAAREESDAEITITFSAVELYNEILRCLLSGRENLQLRMGPGGSSSGAAAGVVLEGAEERICCTCDEAAAVVEAAKANRAVGETRANARSSRSHLILRIKVEILQLNSSSVGGSESTGKAASASPASVSFSLLNLVDLAGSERIDKSGSSDTPLRLREALNINKSLLCLGNVVTALAERSEGKKNVHIPYRDSKLTRLLEDSLGGNAMTALLACITPLPEWHLEQTRATLEFAARAARVVCSPQKNVLKLLPDASTGESSAVIAALQAEVAALKQLLAQSKEDAPPAAAAAGPGKGQLAGKPLQSRLWDSCSSSSSEMTDAAAASCISTAAAAGDATNPRQRLSSGGGWTSRLRLSVTGSKTSPAAATAAAVSEHDAANSSSEAADKQHGSPGSAPPRASSSSLLWKFFHVRGSSVDSKLQGATEGLQAGLPPSGLHSGNHSSLKSAGLLMQASSSAAAAAKGDTTKGDNTQQQQQQQQQREMHPGMLTRWATFHNGSIVRPNSDGGWHTRKSSCSSNFTITSMSEQQQQQQYRGSLGSSGAAEGLDSSSNSLQPGGIAAVAGAAAVALRDHIIKQLVTALQQKKAEIKALKEQQLALQQQLEAARQEGTASRQKLLELAEGIQALAAAREEEFERWKGHLEELEVALQAAQQESLTYRQEALALVHQLTQLQARYRSLQSDQLRRTTILQSASQSLLLQSSQHSEAVQSVYGPVMSVQQSSQLTHCITALLGIEDSLRQLLTQSAAHKTITGPHAAVSRDANSQNGGVTNNYVTDVTVPLQSPRQLPPGLVSSHVIHTVSTRFDMTSGLITKAPKAAERLESVLQQLCGLIPLVKAAAATAAAAAAGVASPSPWASMQLSSKAPGLIALQLDDGGSSSSSNPASPRIPSSPSPVPEARPVSPVKCQKCDSIKPLLAIMQKLKDEVSSLKAAVRTRDEQLAAAAESSTETTRDLEESRQQVGSLQERIDELAVELEAARLAAAAAATEAAEARAAAAAAAAAAADLDRILPPTGAAAAALSACAGVSHQVLDIELSEPESLGAALSRETSGHVPLMSDDTPLPELHEQILLSWHALAMPRSYRTGFVLGHSDSPAAAPWLDRQQCQAHIALLACLHQLQEDQPAAAEVQQQLLREEEQLMDAGLAKLGRREFAALCQQWNPPAAVDAAAKRQALLQLLWQPCSDAAAGSLAAASAAACQLCLSNAPAGQLAVLMLRSNAAVMAATSKALADAAS